MNPSRHGGAREALRAATKGAHRALDHHPVLHRLLSPGLTIEGYGDALNALYLPHAALERQVHDSPWSTSSEVPLAPRRRLLAADMASLGRGTPPLPVRARSPDESEAAWLGQVYVLEGSRLGSAVIARQVRTSLGLQVPLRFFEAGISAAQWQALCALMDQGLPGPQALARAVASARAAFEAYRLGLDAAFAAGVASHS